MSVNIAVTGATGRTGSLVVQKLLTQTQVTVHAAVRSLEKAESKFGSASNLKVFLSDISDTETASKQLESAFQGCKALVITTSAFPQFRVSETGAREAFYLPGQFPENVDYQGQVAQIDAAKRVGVEHVVLISSMGMTNKDHMLNKMGNGNILIWKEKAEDHLRESGLAYTVIRPGGLTDKEGGMESLVVSKDDRAKGVIARADVAEVAVQALSVPAARGKTFDLVAQPGPAPSDWNALFEQAI